MQELRVEKLIPGGQALTTASDGKKVLLWGALPGENVTEYQITKSKSSYIEAVATKIQRTSSHRISPRDNCWLATSPWQIMDYAYELEQKREILREIFRQQKIQLASVDIPAVKTDGKDFGYRNKMEYSLYYSHEDARIHPSFHARGSHRKIIVESSSLEHPAIWRAAEKTIEGLNQARADARKYQSLLLRTNQAGQVAGGLFENHQPHPRFPELCDQILGYEYSYSPNGFFQINLPVYELALRDIATKINASRVLDLYAGVGTIGLSVAREQDLTLVEVDKLAYTELEKNCQNINKAHPILAKSEEALEYITPDIEVIVDPPRAGCDARLIDKLLEITPQKIIYLSCNPVTQARDVTMLLEKYQITFVQPYNFFPRTPHLENLIILERK